MILPTVHTARYLATALARSETRNKSKTFQNLSTNDITNAYFGTSVIPIERREQICHGNGNNSILPNVSLPHSCTECPSFPRGGGNGHLEIVPDHSTLPK